MANLEQNYTSHLNLRETADIYRSYGASIKALFSAASDQVKLYRQRIEARAQLASMNSKMLDDIGVSPMEAMQEANKPFWRA